MNKIPLFDNIPEESKKILNSFDTIIQHIKPLTSKQLLKLPDTIRELSHLPTDDRSSRRTGYMNDTVMLSSYVRYFMWWNLVRLTPLFSGFLKDKDIELVFDSLNDNSIMLDIGSGPLTVPIALWLACPELRKKQLTWYCLDYSQTSLSFGEEIFLSIASKTAEITPDQKIWNIIRVKGAIGTEIRKKASFITCANMFNELYWNSTKPLEETAKKYSNLLVSYAAQKASFLIIEPGIPRAARFITLLRDSFLRKKQEILSPCPQYGACPMDGRKGGKWCHFVLSTEKAPPKLHKISSSAGIPKDRASLSFVFSSSVITKKQTSLLPLRIISDSITLYDKTNGRYSCSKEGLTLAIAPEKQYTSGDLVQLTEENILKLSIDRKSGAKKIRL